MKRMKFNRDLAKFTDRQLLAVRTVEQEHIKFLLYGGALGGGKSYFLRWYCVRFLIHIFALFQVKNVTAMLACEDYPSLKDRQLQKLEIEFPAWLGKSHGDHKIYGRSFVLHPDYGSGVICFRNLDDPSKYQSAEFALIAVDELTKNLYDVFTFLRSRLRFPGVPDEWCKFIAGTNPGGVGHGWCKQLWMDGIFPPEWTAPIDFSQSFAYVPSKADDNPHLDEAYWAQLQTLPPNLRKAFRDGDWNIFIGQAFPDFVKEIHVIDPIDVPMYAPIYMTFDWGYGKPFSVGWWWVDADGRFYRFSEWYGWAGVPDEGLRITDEEIAKGIVKRERALKIHNRSVLRLCDPTCFNKKPDYKGGGQGPSTAEEFAKESVYLSPGDPSRSLKIRQMHLRLQQHDDKAPMMLVYSTCDQFIRTIPNLVMDKKNPEDVDTDTEDHIYDEAALMCMARPISLVVPPKRIPEHERRINELESLGTDDYEEAAIQDMHETMRDLGVSHSELDDAEHYDDGQLISTVE